MKPKKVPLRMCVGCGEMKPKRTLIRIVKQPNDTICLDGTGKKAGRGAYLCCVMACLEQAKKARRLEKAFSCQISDAVYESLRQQLSETEAAADA